jgi:hypothetical protein
VAVVVVVQITTLQKPEDRVAVVFSVLQQAQQETHHQLHHRKEILAAHQVI